ncbi:PREDICTED: probable protein phosphatase 2C 80 [Camelina sativa]|uniref:Protein phosphatase n=1 Tax=Camelina sativa TaxID=90675 RepID=A0ABM0W346_CAMSA|nr:PREDICTED: probable protein phosphatase 2C 80 [Camelina sativa]XP_010465014.1 PREDICTED: probable protein phosphatase 2C 80 [Camelina sativa]
MSAATALSRLNPVSQFGFQRIVAGGKSKSFGRRLFSDSSRRFRQAMAASGSLPVFGDACLDDLATTCSNGLDFTKKRSSGATSFSFNFPVASMRLGKREGLAKNRLVCHYSAIDPLQKNRALFGALSKSLHTSSISCFSVGPAHELSSLNGGSQDSPPTTTALKSLRLVSGSCYLPHPEKEATGGEDAHFISDDEQAIGVADGVGGWAEVGVNAGLFSRELMSHSLSAIQERHKGSSIDPLMVLEKAHSQTRAKGSSTACIIALTDKGLHAINLGDSGFTVVREGTTVFQSPVQQHGFNFTYQLESGNSADVPSSGQVFTIDVESGDVIVAGTDGMYDNLYNEEITGVVVSSVRAGLDPKATAQKIADLARQRAVDKKRQSPFATAAQEAGYRYYGGKLDDITVVVSYITSP